MAETLPGGVAAAVEAANKKRQEAANTKAEAIRKRNADLEGVRRNSPLLRRLGKNASFHIGPVDED